jgi:DNA-binding NtrC family response regulator
MPPPDNEPHSASFSHTCLAGPEVSRNRALTELLVRQLSVTLVDDPRQLLRTSFLATLATFDILALDCDRHTEEVLALVRNLKALHPGLDIVLIDGHLTQSQLAAAFAAGARDYFPAAYDAALLAERISGLSRWRQRAAADAPGAEGSHE